MNSTDQGDRTLARGWRAVAFLAFALWGGFPAAAAGPFPKAGLPVVDSGIVVESEVLSSTPPIIWMDNDRIIFTGLKTGASPTSPRGAQTRDVVIYHTRTGERSKYADGAVTCYEADRIVYVTEHLVWKDEATGVARSAIRLKHGPVGQEKEEFLPSDRPHEFGCSGAAEPRWRSLPPDRRITLLRPEHGYLDRGRVGSDPESERVALVRPGRPSIELPVYGHEARGAAVYAPWADQYVLNASGAAFLPYIRIEPSPKPVIRLLKPDGELTELAPPDAFFKRFRSSGPIRLTRAGMVYTGLDARDYPGKEQGLYLVNGQQVAQLVDGRVENIAVSPDGCRIALSSARDVHPIKYPRTTKIVQLCG